MAYCRQVEGQSDIYLYADESGCWTCCFCRLNQSEQWHGYTIGDVREHLRQHEAAGHIVPGNAVREIEKEVVEHGPAWDGGDWNDDWDDLVDYDESDND